LQSVGISFGTGSIGFEENVITRQAVAGNRNTPLATLQTLAGDEVVSVRKAVAINPFTPNITLSILCEDRELGIRQSVASNPRASAEILHKLCRDPIFMCAEKSPHIET